jgi:hypothetical protein
MVKWLDGMQRAGVGHAALVALLLAIDYLCFPLIRFPILYLIPVVLVTQSRPAWGFGLAVSLPLVRLGFAGLWPVSWDLAIAVINALIQILALVTLAWLVQRIMLQARELRTLRGLLPVCCLCKKIRDQHNTWEPMEVYLAAHSEARFSHSFCPECARAYYGELLEGLPETPAAQDSPVSRATCTSRVEK